MRALEQFQGLTKAIDLYFNAYGGWGAIFSSPFLYFSVFIVVLSYPAWWGGEWSIMAQTLIPSLLGFSLGTYSILFSVMTGRVRNALREETNSRGISYLDEINATFFHFIFVQIITLFAAFLYDGGVIKSVILNLSKYAHLPIIFEVTRVAGSAFGQLLVVYSFALCVAAALSIYTIASIKDPGEK